MPRSAESGQGADTAAALYERSGAAAYDVSAEQFAAILDEILSKYLSHNSAQNSSAPSSHVSAEHKAAFCAALRLEELALARACAAGSERAWQDFIGRYRQKLHRMGLHITRDGAHAAGLADSLFADLYGVNARDGARRSKLVFYNGRGSPEGWLRTVMAQGFNHSDRQPERAGTLGLHESSVSRRLDRLATGLRKRILAGLRTQGMSHAQATEALETDVRDLQVNLRSRLTQDSGAKPFPGRKVPAQEAGDGSHD